MKHPNFIVDIEFTEKITYSVTLKTIKIQSAHIHINEHILNLPDNPVKNLDYYIKMFT